MKVRNDNIKNSSNSSYIIARKDELTEKQKEIIVDFVLDNMLGKKVASTKEELMQYFKEERCWHDDDFNNPDSYNYKQYAQALKEIENGLSIYSGYVYFDTDDGIDRLLDRLWSKLEENASDDFAGVDISLEH